MNVNELLSDTDLEAMLARLTTRRRADGLEASIMAAVDTTPQRRRPWVTWPEWRWAPAPAVRLLWLIAILGLLLALVAGTLVVGSRFFVHVVPAPVFSWTQDDLRDWVTDDEITDALRGMSVRYFGAELDGDVASSVSVDESANLVWSFRLAGGEGSWRVIAHNGSHDGTYVGPPTETDPRLPPGVVFQRGEGFAYGFYILSGPNSRQSICMSVLPPGAVFGPQGSDVDVHEDRVFALASMMLHEMGWVD